MQGFCTKCKRLKIIANKTNVLCQYCYLGDYQKKYHKEHREIYNTSLNNWREKTGKKSIVYEHKYNYAGNREKVIQRDGEKCVKCGMTREDQRRKSGCDLSVDHINGIGKYDTLGGKRNSLADLQTLCSACHLKKTFNYM